MDWIGQIFFWAILATPIMAFLFVRKMQAPVAAKILLALVIIAVLGFTFYAISIDIIFRDGMGP